MENILIKNKNFCLTLGSDCVAKSLIFTETGEECIEKGNELPLFSLTEDRPFNNEIKLAHPNKKTIFDANRVRREGNKLIVGFEIITFEAVVEIKEEDDYIAFKLSDYIIKPTDFGHLAMSPPPVAEFRLLQLPIKKREHFGEWLNVMWDDKIAVNVLSTSPYARIDSEKRKDCRILCADAVREIKLLGCEAALVVSKTNNLLDAIEKIEEDYNLPSGVKSRRSKAINRSTYWTPFLTPENVDEHIKYAKLGGFTTMLLYYSCVFKNDTGGYTTCGDYDYRDEYPNKEADLKKMLDKIKAAGITPGLHFLQTHIGNCSRYVTPVADHRLNLTRHFTLAKPLGTDDTEVFVEENPENTVMYEKCRILKFNGELIHYTSYSTEYPYKFTGCTRGHWDTNVRPHEKGTIGGILDVSEFGGHSVYINQYTSLQDEVAEKLALAYNQGVEFIYFDGSEGTNPPFDFHVPNAQYRVYKKLNKEPLYCEGAAKSHFSWHMISGGNAFDIWQDENFKDCIKKYQMEAAGRIVNDFTRINFGWWAFRETTQPDLFEFGISRSVAYDCPITVQMYPEVFSNNPRMADTFEIFKMWEDVRINNLLSAEEKNSLKNPNQEHILLLNEENKYELLEYNEIKDVCGGSGDIKAFVFERKGKSYVVFWHTKGEGSLLLDGNIPGITLENNIGKNNISFKNEGATYTLPLKDRTYLSTTLSQNEIISIFKGGKVL